MKVFIKILIVLTFSSIMPSQVAAANPYLRARNNFNMGLFGDASILSINYERLFANNRDFFLAGRLGIGYSYSLGIPSKSASLVSTPFHLTGNIRVYGKRHFLEFGLGSTLLFYEYYKFWDYCIYPVIGYRLQPLKSDKFTCRIFVSYPLTDKLDIDNYWFFPVGLSLGFCF